MRFLLLLSALLGALTGVAGTRVEAQPVQASATAAAAAAIAGAAAVAVEARRFAIAPYAATPPRTLGPARPISSVAARILYAERRRE